jgi:hypothetical protein
MPFGNGNSFGMLGDMIPEYLNAFEVEAPAAALCQ